MKPVLLWKELGLFHASYRKEATPESRSLKAKFIYIKSKGSMLFCSQANTKHNILISVQYLHKPVADAGSVTKAKFRVSLE
jgi:hypothetical protein